MLLRRCFSIYDAKPRGVYGGTVDFVYAVHGKGTQWLARQRQHDPIDVVGPLGRPFALPRQPANVTLVGGGYGTAPLFSLAEALRARGCRVDFVMGAATESKLFGYLDAKRMSASIAVTTDDGSMGEQGRVSDVLPEVLERTGLGRRVRLRPDGHARGGARGSPRSTACPCQTAVEESMACGIGVCMTCVLPVIGDDGVTRMVRSCVEGPVFAGDRVRWDDVGTVPDDALGAPPPGARSRTGRGPGRGRQRQAAVVVTPAKVDMSTTLAGVPLPEPGLHRLRLRRGRPGARAVRRRHQARRRRHQVDHGQAALRPGDPAHGRDAQRHAQQHRPAGAGHRGLPRQGPRLARGQGRPYRRLDRRQQRRRVRRPGPPAARPHGHLDDRGQHLLPQRRGPRPGVRLRPRRSLGRHPRGHGATARPTCRSSPSSRPTSPTSSRSPGPASTPAPTACR